MSEPVELTCAIGAFGCQSLPWALVLGALIVVVVGTFVVWALAHRQYYRERRRGDDA